MDSIIFIWAAGIIFLLIVILLLVSAFSQRTRAQRRSQALEGQLDKLERKLGLVEAAYTREKEQKEMFQALSEQEKRANMLDSLTNLQNYRSLIEWVDNVTATIRKEEKVAILHIDMDNFKRVNDELGHVYGDELLIDVAHRLLQAADENDFLARTEGDDFMMVTQNIDDIDEYEEKIRKIEKVMSYPFLLAGRELVVTISMGICFAPRDGITTRTLLRNADIAMQSAKRQGKNTYCYYSEELEEKSTSTMELQAKLRSAISGGELEAWYEPWIDLTSGEPGGFSATVRWNHPEEGLVDFAAYEELAEQTGLSIQVGEWLLNEVCTQLTQWKKEGRRYAVSLSLYEKQLMEAGFLGKLDAVLAQHEIQGSELIFAVREEMMVRHLDSVKEILSQIRERGIRISLHEYGDFAGSLTVLRRIPADLIRLSYGFFREELERDGGLELLEGLAAVIRSLGMELGAEKIEDPEEEMVLQRLQCSRVCGLLYGEPLPGSKIRM